MGLLSLGYSDIPQATGFLIKHSSSQHPELRYASVEGLAKRPDQPGVKETIFKAFDDSDSRVQIAAISAATPWANDAIMAKMNSILVHITDPHVQQAIILAMGSRLDDFPKNVEVLVPKLNDLNPETAFITLQVVGPHIEKFPQIQKAFFDIPNDTSKPIEMQAGALQFISKLKTPESKNLLVDNLYSADWQKRQASALGLGNFPDADIPDILAPKVFDPEWQVCQSVAVSLGKFDTPKAIESTIPLLRHDNAAVRQAEGLSFGGKLQKFPELVNPFIETMKLEEDPYTRHIFAAALKSMPNDSNVKLEMNKIQESLIPGLRIDPWEQIRPETGVEIGYSTIIDTNFGDIDHTFLNVTYNGDTRIISFDTKLKPLGFLLPKTEGRYFEELNASSKNIAYFTLTIDPVEVKRLYDLAPSLSQKQGSYNLFDFEKLGRNCFGARNVALESAGIYSEIPDMPWETLRPNYFSRSISTDFSDRYSSYSFRMNQEVLYSLPNTRTLKTNSWSRYQTNWQYTSPSTSWNRYKPNWRYTAPSTNWNQYRSTDWSKYKYNSPSFNYQSPNLGTHNYNTQKYQWPSYQAPSLNSPSYQPPTFDSPAYDPPSYSSPTFTPIQSPSSGLSNWP